MIAAGHDLTPTAYVRRGGTWSEGGKLDDSVPYRGTSLIRNTPLLEPYSRTIPRVVWWSWRLFLTSEVPL